MKVSVSVAYRVYNLKSQTKAIAFHTQSKQFMFLEGLSAQLLQLILDDNQDNTSCWLRENDLTESEVEQFIEQLRKFGLFDSENEAISSVDTSRQSATDDENLERRPELNRFMSELRENGLYYCFHIDLTNRCNEKCIHCYHPFDQYDYRRGMV